MVEILTCCALVGECILIHFAITALKNHIKIQKWKIEEIENTKRKDYEP